MDNQPAPQQQYQPVAPQPPVQPQPVYSQPFTATTETNVQKQNRTMEFMALGAVILLFVSIFFGASILSKILLLAFAAYAVVYIIIDYTKNRKMAQSALANQQQILPQGYQVTPGQQVIYVVQEKGPKTTAQKALKITLIVGGTAFFVIFVLPVIGFILLIIIVGSSGQSTG